MQAAAGSDSSPGTLEDRVIMVSGAAGGIGSAAAAVFAAAGAKLVLTDIAEDNDGVRSICNRGGEAIFVAADIANEAHVAAVVAAANRTFGRLDGAFNNAGVGERGKPLHELSLADWDRCININLRGIFLCMKYQIPAMLAHGRGSIVNTSSGLANVAAPGFSEYSASKAGVLALTRGAAADYGSRGIRVNAVLPGIVKTKMVEHDRISAQVWEILRHRHLLQRFAEPREIAELVKWLLSDAASFVTGASLCIDGGYTAN